MSTNADAWRRQWKVVDRLIKTMYINFLATHRINPETCAANSPRMQLCHLLSSHVLKAKPWTSKGEPYRFFHALFGRTLPEWAHDESKHSLSKVFGHAQGDIVSLRVAYHVLLRDVYKILNNTTCTRGFIVAVGANDYRFEANHFRANDLTPQQLPTVYQQTLALLDKLSAMPLNHHFDLNGENFFRAQVKQQQRCYFQQTALTKFIAQKRAATPTRHLPRSATSPTTTTTTAPNERTRLVADPEPVFDDITGTEDDNSVSLRIRGSQRRQAAKRRNQCSLTPIIKVGLFAAGPTALVVPAVFSKQYQQLLLEIPVAAAIEAVCKWAFNMADFTPDTRRTVGVYSSAALLSLIWMTVLTLVYCCCCCTKRRPRGYAVLVDEAGGDDEQVLQISDTVAADAVASCQQIVTNLHSGSFTIVTARLQYETYNGPANEPLTVNGLDKISYDDSKLFPFTYYLQDGATHCLQLSYADIKQRTKQIMAAATHSIVNVFRANAIKFICHLFKGENQQASTTRDSLIRCSTRVNPDVVINIDLQIGDNTFTHTGPVATLMPRLQFLFTQLPPAGAADAINSGSSVVYSSLSTTNTTGSATVASTTSSSTSTTTVNNRIYDTVPDSYEPADMELCSDDSSSSTSLSSSGGR